MKLRLPETICSPQDLKAVTLEVRQYARWYAHASIKKKASGGHAPAQPAISPAARAIIRAWTNDKAFDRKDLDKLIDAMEDYQRTAPQLSITLAAPPSGGLKRTLIAWCRENVDPDVLVNFQFNSTLLGGLVVRWRSHIFDWSFRRRILESRQNFPEVLRRV